MQRIFDNISTKLLPALQKNLELFSHADFWVGYSNLRAWKHLAAYIEKWSGDKASLGYIMVCIISGVILDLNLSIFFKHRI